MEKEIYELFKRNFSFVDREKVLDNIVNNLESVKYL